MTASMTLWAVRGMVCLLAAIAGRIWASHAGIKGQMERALAWLSFVVPFGAGGFFPIFYLLTGGYLLCVLVRWRKTGHAFRLYWNTAAAAAALLAMGYLLTPLWAADRGSAWLGVTRTPVLLLYLLAWMQTESRERQKIERAIPAAGALMVLASIPMQYIPGLQSMIAPQGRLAGFFEYSNTFALFLVAGMAVQYTKKERTRRDDGIDLILMLGIFLSGSRTSFLLLGAVLIAGCLYQRRARFALTALGMFALLLGGSMVLRLVLGQVAANRYLTTSVRDSTLLVRLLYWKDAVPVLLRHPFGLGYMGYRAVQGSIQTGVYSVAFVHNGLLQLLLDIGWVPTAALLWAVIWSFFRRGADCRKRLLLAVILGHCMMDFDLQFLSVWLILLPLLDVQSGRELWLQKEPEKLAGAAVVILLLLGAWMTTGDMLCRLGLNRQCLTVTPFYTPALERQLSECENAAERNETAEQILRQNPYSADAWEAKAEAAGESRNLSAMIVCGERVMELNPYDRNVYLRCFDRLWNAMEACQWQRNRAGVRQCAEALRDIPRRMETVKRETDPLGWKIQHRPQLNLPAEYQRKLEGLRGM